MGGVFARHRADEWNTRLGNINPMIYGLANTQYNTAGFHDVTSGNNNYNGVTGFSAGTGYDEVTGWGTIDFNTFANAAKTYLSSTATPTPTATATSTSTATVKRRLRQPSLRQLLRR